MIVWIYNYLLRSPMQSGFRIHSALHLCTPIMIVRVIRAEWNVCLVCRGATAYLPASPCTVIGPGVCSVYVMCVLGQIIIKICEGIRTREGCRKKDVGLL